MQQRGRELALHALAKRELARRLVEQRREVEQLGQLAERLVELGLGHVEHRAVHRVGLRRGQIPDQLRLLPHHQGDLLEEIGLPLERHVALDLGLAARRMQQAGEHLQRRGLAGTVGPEEADALAALDRKAHAIDCLDELVLAAHQRLHRGGKPRRSLVHPEVLRQLARADHGSSPSPRAAFASSPTVLIGSESTASPSSIDSSR